MSVGTSRDFADGFIHKKTVPEAILSQVVSGAYEISIPGGSERIEPGELFLTPAGTPLTIGHHYGRDRYMEARWLHFYGTLYRHHELTSLLNMPLRVSGDAARAISDIIGEMLTPMDHSAASGDKSINSRQSVQDALRTRELIYRLVGLVWQISDLKPGSLALLEHSARMTPVLDYIAENLSHSIKIETLADRACMSPSHFHMVFKEQFGHAPMEYVRLLRVREACRLLVHEELSVSEIADIMGFSNPYHFCRVFKTIQGVPPSTYRAENRLHRI